MISLSSGSRLNEAQQPLAIELYDLTSTEDADTDERSAAGKHVRFAGELACFVNDDAPLGLSRRSHDFQFARRDHKEGHGLIALLDQHFSFDNRSLTPVRGYARDLIRR